LRRKNEQRRHRCCNDDGVKTIHQAVVFDAASHPFCVGWVKPRAN
jgi:hypothetical protein